MEYQSVAKCSELREAQQEKTFTKMDELHGMQMTALGGIEKKLAYKDGQENGRRKNDQPSSSSSKMNLQRLFFQIAVTWGPPLGFVIVLGCIYWLKLNGYL